MEKRKWKKEIKSFKKLETGRVFKRDKWRSDYCRTAAFK